MKKDIWNLLDHAMKASYKDAVWAVMLNYWGCHRTGPQHVAPCPCIWRRPPTGAIPHEVQRELRWDWRSAKRERSVRLALQYREPVREDAAGNLRHALA